MQTLREIDGYTITEHQGLYTLIRGENTVHVRWTRRGYRCDCGERGCCHRDVVTAARRTPTPPGWDTDLEPWT
jgi:hypothetical protein